LRPQRSPVEAFVGASWGRDVIIGGASWGTQYLVLGASWGHLGRAILSPSGPP
jgi:hypothetical protein